MALVASIVVVASPLSMPGCGGASGQSEMVIPKDSLHTVTRDSREDYLRSDAHKQSLHGKGRRVVTHRGRPG
jgi:hypothetical protein